MIICWYSVLSSVATSFWMNTKKNGSPICTPHNECLILGLRLLLLLFAIHSVWCRSMNAMPIKCIDAKMSIIIISCLSDFVFVFVFVLVRKAVEWSHAAHEWPSSVILLSSSILIKSLWQAVQRKKSTSAILIFFHKKSNAEKKKKVLQLANKNGQHLNIFHWCRALQVWFLFAFFCCLMTGHLLSLCDACTQNDIANSFK